MDCWFDEHVEREGYIRAKYIKTAGDTAVSKFPTALRVRCDARILNNMNGIRIDKPLVCKESTEAEVSVK